MKPAEQWSLFGEMIVTVILIAVAFFYFIIGDRIVYIAAFLNNLMPVFVIIGVFILKNQINRYQYKKYVNFEDRKFLVNLNLGHVLINNLVLLGAPLMILIVALFMKNIIEQEDVVQACLVFVIFYYWQRKIYSEKEY